jgi:hypothetical protein
LKPPFECPSARFDSEFEALTGLFRDLELDRPLVFCCMTVALAAMSLP